eukprot:tig00000042_g15431.t1
MAHALASLAGDPPGGAGARSPPPRRASAADCPAGMGRGWIERGVLELGGEGRTEWPAAEIAAAGPENIRWLELRQNDLTSIPGTELAKLTNLEVLFLDGNQLTALPPELFGLAALQSLDLSNNKLTALPPEIGRLAALQGLYVSNNQLTALPPEIGRLAALLWLNAKNNRLTALPPEIGRLGALQWLDVNSNQLKSLPPEIGRLANLQTLDVSNNQLTALPPEIGRLAALQWLDVSGNKLTALPPEIGHLDALATLSVHNNPVVDSWPEPVRRAVNNNTSMFGGQAQCAAIVPYLRSLPNAAAEPGPASPPAASPAAPASAIPAASSQYDVFLSHERDTAGPLARALKVHLEQARPGLRVFLEADEPRPELHRIKEMIDASASVVLIISKDVLKSSSVLGEVRHAIGAGKSVVLLHDEVSCPFPAADEVPEDMRPALARRVILYPVANKRKAASIEALLEECAAALREEGRPAQDEGASNSGGAAKREREEEEEEEEKEADGAKEGPTQKKRVVEGPARKGLED